MSLSVRQLWYGVAVWKLRVFEILWPVFGGGDKSGMRVAREGWRQITGCRVGTLRKGDGD